MIFFSLRLSFLVSCCAVGSTSASSFAAPVESANDMLLFDSDLTSSFWEDTELTMDPLLTVSSSDDQLPSLFDDEPSFFSLDLSAPMSSLDLDQDLLAATDNACVFLDDQFIGKRRRADEFCSPNTVPAKKKSTENPIPGAGNVYPNFPPPDSNPGRYGNSPLHDPAPRPTTDWVNTDFDFIYCPSGRWGYRQYAICDSGSELDRHIDRLRNLITLVNVTPRASFIDSMIPFK